MAQHSSIFDLPADDLHVLVAAARGDVYQSGRPAIIIGAGLETDRIARLLRRSGLLRLGPPQRRERYLEPTAAGFATLHAHGLTVDNNWNAKGE